MEKVVPLCAQRLLAPVEQQLAADLHVEDIGMKASSLSWTMPTNTSSPVMTLSTTTPHHDWYIQNLEGEDIPSTFALNDEDDKTDK